MQPTLRIVGIKTEYSKRNLCDACLSTDRKLDVLGELEEIYQRICSTSFVEEHSELRLCWECRALLRSAKCFQIRVTTAQCALKACCNNLPSSLSRLSHIKRVIVDSYPKSEENEPDQKLQNEIKQKYEVEIDEKKVELQEQAIKIENENECNNDFDDDFDYEPIEEVKDENLPETILKELQGITAKKVKLKKTKPQPADRTKRYKMTYRKLGDVAVKVPIDEKEVDSWLEKERNCTFYNKLKVKCTKCVSRIHYKVTLRDHQRKRHYKSKTKQFHCHICQQYFSLESKLNLHVQGHYHYYRCTLCSYSCYNRYNMSHHLKEHSRIVNCLECEGIFSNTRKFFVHYKAAHTVFICAHCDKRYRAKNKLEKHIFRWHTTHRCEQCNVSFSSYRSHTEHNNLKHRIERSEATFCVQCNLQFDTVPLFRRHINSSVAHSHERKETPKKPLVSCPSCPNVYARKTSMMNHYRFVHLKQTKHYCSICEKWFLTSTRYKDHVRSQHEHREKERNKICYVCGRGFFEKRILENHMRTHTGERPFSCPHCDAKFAQKVAMDSHVRFIHLKDKRKNTSANRTGLGN